MIHTRLIILGVNRIMKGNKKGQAGIGVILSVVVGLILLVGVSIPIVNEVIASANLTGLGGTVVAFIPVFLAIAGLVLATAIIGGSQR
jgi:hypothetical protein